jgi:hypothetical protein
MTDRGLKLPPGQEAVRRKCFHPTGTFVEFPKEEIEEAQRLLLNKSETVPRADD